jgi:hypothetical protein
MSARQIALRGEFYNLKTLLERTAEQYHYDFGHPQVLSISQQLDGVIVKIMKERQVDAVYELAAREL